MTLLRGLGKCPHLQTKRSPDDSHHLSWLSWVHRAVVKVPWTTVVDMNVSYPFQSLKNGNCSGCYVCSWGHVVLVKVCTLEAPILTPTPYETWYLIIDRVHFTFVKPFVDLDFNTGDVRFFHKVYTTKEWKHAGHYGMCSAKQESYLIWSLICILLNYNSKSGKKLGQYGQKSSDF